MDIDAVRTALATEPLFANNPQERDPPLLMSEDPVKNPAVPLVDNVHAPNPVVLSFCVFDHPLLYVEAEALLVFACEMDTAAVVEFAKAQEPFVTTAL
jgi:hypothetical protein